jgi:KipI family sensor histidine kinase inhibitor
MRVLEYGWDNLLLEVDDPLAWFAALRDDPETDVDEIVPAAQTVLLRGVRRLPDLETVRPRRQVAAADQVSLPVRWTGEDYESVAAQWDADPAEIMRTTVFTVAFCGFMPGFAYLAGLPTRFHLPRLDTPRTRVPAGSVAIAGPYAGVYPRSSPGGWHLLGDTDATLFDLESPNPATLSPGTQLRFTDA